MTRPQLFAVFTIALTPALAWAIAPATDGNRPASGTAPHAPQAPAVPLGTSGQVVYETQCAVCHGTTGKGDGPAAAALNPKPRSFQDPAWQAGISDANLEKVILQGGPAVSKSPLMPAFPKLAEDRTSLAQLKALIRGFAPKKAK